MKTVKFAIAIVALQLARVLAGALAAQEPEAAPAPDAGAEEPAVGSDFTPDQPPSPPPTTVEPGAPAGPTAFREPLVRWGRWIERPDYGEVWVPSVAASWRPYTAGRWVYTDQGWGWVSEEPWGWATYHYGRWYYDQEIGWAWVPGTVWAPAWVAWRHGGGYLGWAPLPPSVGFTVNAGLDLGGIGITPGFYLFVGERDILAPRAAAVIVSTTRNVTIVRNTSDITSYAVANGRVIDRGVSVQRIQQVTGRAVPTQRVAALAAGGSRGKVGAFYQPPAIAKAARATKAEFGKALPAQVAAQRGSRSVPQRATAAQRGASANATGGASGRTAAGAQSGSRRSRIGERTTGGQAARSAQAGRTSGAAEGQTAQQPRGPRAPAPQPRSQPAPQLHRPAQPQPPVAPSAAGARRAPPPARPQSERKPPR